MFGKPLTIDLFCGLGGWTDGFLAEGYFCIGFDIERRPYPGHLVLQDVTTLHGRQFRDATVIVASPPCQAYSYRAMPWKRAKALPPPDNTLFDACFRIQREASEAAGRPIPMVVENVCGAQKWVGKAKWHYGSYYLWGDVPALMPMVSGRSTKLPAGNTTSTNWSERPIARLHDAYKTTGMNWSDRSKHGQDFTRVAGAQAESRKGPCGDWFKDGRQGQDACLEGIKQPGLGGGQWGWWKTGMAKNSSKSNARKQASALIAKIPFPLAQWIARTYHPNNRADER